MRILLPPSETKRDGGTAPDDDDRLLTAAPGSPTALLTAQLVALSGDPARARRVLGLTEKQAPPWLERNAALASSPRMPALDRFTGVLFDALGAASLPESARVRARESVLIHSALLGLVGAGEPIPSYRLGAGAALGLRALWGETLAAQLAALEGLVLDLRSDGYRALGPLADRPGVHRLHVVSQDADGRRRALNHFNKKAKGLFVRRLLLADTMPATTDALLTWAAASGIRLELQDAGELVLVAESVEGAGAD